MSLEARPKVSVCMLAYNNSAYVEQAIESVLVQETDFHVELVISEDKSTDDVAEKIKKFKNTGLISIKAHFNEVNVGLTANLALALSKCSGEYIALLDNDDYWSDPKKLAKQVNFMDENPAVVICYHPIELLNNGMLTSDRFRKPPQITDIRELAKGNFIGSNSVLFRAKAFQGFPPEYFSSPVNDYFLLMLLAKNGLIGRIDQSMAVYRIHSASDWSSRPDQSLAILSYLECMIGLFDDEIDQILIDRHKKIASGRLLDNIAAPAFDQRLLQSIKYGGDCLQIVLQKKLIRASFFDRVKHVIRKALQLLGLRFPW